MSKEEAKRPLPNNIYGLISFVIQTMGDRATPLLVSAGILFAIFMFYREQVASQQAIKEAEEAVIARNQEEARKQQQRIDEAYSRISTLTNDQIESVEALLRLQSDAAKALEEQRSKTTHLVTLSEQEIASAKEARARADVAIIESKSRKDELTNIEGKLVAKEQELEKLEQRLEEEKRGLSKRVAEIDTLRTNYQNIARAVLELAKTSSDTPEIVQSKAFKLAKSVGDEYFPKAGLEDPRVLWLRAFAENPGEASLLDLEKLIGTKMDEPESLFTPDLGFEAWIKISTDYGDTFYCGVVERTENSLDNLLWLELSSGESPDKENSPRVGSMRRGRARHCLG